MEGSAAHSFLAASSALAVADDMVESLEGGERSGCEGVVSGLGERSTLAPKVTGSCFSFAAIVT